jgi:hypothetical protein
MESISDIGNSGGDVVPKYRQNHVKILDSFDFNEIPDDFSKLCWVLLPLILDSEGRGIYSMPWLRSKLFPIRDDVELERLTAAFEFFTQRGMIIVYEVDGRSYFYIPSWKTYQSGTQKEAASVLPAPPDLLLSSAGVAPELGRVAASASASESESVGESESALVADPETDPVDPELNGINQFTREEVSEERDLVTIYMNVTGNMGLPVKSADRKALIESLRDIHANKNSHTADYLRPFFKAWCDRNYSKTNIGWLDWAMSGEVKDKKDSPAREKSASQKRLEKLMGGK